MRLDGELTSHGTGGELPLLRSFADEDDFSRLREAFDRAGFSAAGILAITGGEALNENDVPLLLSRTVGDDPLYTLVRLFLLDQPCAAAAVQEAVDPVTLGALVRCGLVSVRGDTVRGRFRLMAVGNLFLVFDSPALLGSSGDGDYVMGPGASSLLLGRLMVNSRGRRTLDLGCGCGLHACLAAPRSAEVVACDLNPRAAMLTAFSARLNGLTQVHALAGDRAEAMAPGSFDLIVSNPPFVLSPERRYLYRDAEEGFCRTLVRTLWHHLAPEGFCQLLCSWGERRGEDWRAELHSWVEGLPVETWVLRTESCDARAYAATWLRHTARDGGELQLDAWLSYLEGQGLSTVGSGLICLRRTGLGAWFAADDLAGGEVQMDGDDIVRGFGLRSFVARHPHDADLLACRLRLSPAVRLEQQYAPTVHGWGETATRLKLDGGLPFSSRVDHALANLVVRCTGELSLGVLLDDTAVQLGTAREHIVPPLCATVRTLIERGVLLPAS